MKNKVLSGLFSLVLALAAVVQSCSPVDPPALTPSPTVYSGLETPPATMALGNRYVIMANEYVTLRSQASVSSDAIAQLIAGTVVTLKGYDGLYAHVEANGKTGYVLAGYLAPENADPYLSAMIVKDTSAYSYDQMVQDLASLSSQFPSMLRIENIGRSVLGRDIPVAILGNPNAGKHVLVQSAIHAREHMTSLLSMAQIEYCLRFASEAYQGVAISSLLNDVCLHIIPMSNPDGVMISQGEITDDALSAIYNSDKEAGRTDRPLVEYLPLWKANYAGVDLNRNFDARWESIDPLEGPSSSNYKGERPEDQPEAQALIHYAQKYDFSATISYHAFGSILFWDFPAPENVRAQSESLALAVKAVTDYPMEPYVGTDAGGFKDWAMSSLSIPSLTIEIGTRSCPLPRNEFATIWERNRLVLPAVALWSKNN